MAGTIITFYSYKGGTGRTMAISNVAWILASNGFRVLLIDWDLESPGVHRYLRPFLADPELTRTRGLVDFLSDAASEGRADTLQEYAVSVNWRFHTGGAIDFLPAGLQDENYPQRVNTFDWSKFYGQLGGSRLLERMRGWFRANYDYVLIDSRTGLSDTSSICTALMPDLLVVFFILNRQSINGSAAIAASIQKKRGKGFRIFPVPTRIEHGELERLDAATAHTRRLFAPFLLHVQSGSTSIDPRLQAKYWNDVETPYSSFYAFEEVLAVFKDDPGSRRGVLAPNERIASWITDGAVRSLQPEGEETRRTVVEAYAFKPDDVVELGWAPRTHDRWSFWFTMRGSFRRHGWQYAAIACAAVIAAMVLYDYITEPSRTALNSDLSAVFEDLRQVEKLVSESGNSDPLLKPSVLNAIDRLQAVRRALSKAPPPAQSPSAPKRQGPVK